MYECMSFIALHNYLCFAVHMAINLLNLEYYCNMRPTVYVQDPTMCPRTSSQYLTVVRVTLSSLTKVHASLHGYAFPDHN